MKKNIVVTVPKLTAPGGVSAFWNALLPEFSAIKEVELKPLEIGGYGKNILGPLIDQWRFRKKVDSSVDLVVLNPSLGFRSFFRDGLFAKQLASKKVTFVVFFHGWDPAFEKKVDKKHLNFFRTSFGKASKIFVLSNAFKIKLIEWGFKGDVIVETTNVDINLLVDFSIHQKFEHQRSTDSIKLLFLSRLLKDKGIFETIDAFVKLKEEHLNLELIIAGDGMNYEEVIEYAEHIEGVVITGHVDGQEKIELLKQSHLYCLPSYSEGLPTSVLEAMAFGMPVITTPVGGLIDFFQDEIMGYFVQPKNVQQTVEKLDLLLSNRETIAKMGMSNHNYAIEHLTSTKMSNRLYEHFTNAIIE